MTAKLVLIKSRIKTPAVPAVLDKQGKETAPAVPAVWENKVEDLTTHVANVGSSINALSWVFVRNISESDNLVILRGLEPFKKLFGKAFTDAMNANGVKVELEYSDDGIYPVRYTLDELTRKFSACEQLSAPWKTFMTEYTRITSGILDKKVVKKVDTTTTTTTTEGAALSLLNDW